MAEEITQQALPTANPNRQPSASVFPGVSSDEPSLADMLRQELGEEQETTQETVPEPKKPAPRKVPVATEEEEDAEESADSDDDDDLAEANATDEEDDESESDDDAEETESDDEKDATDDDDDAPAGLKGVPKGVVKRLQKQSGIIRELRAQIAAGGIVITPTALNPLADIPDLKTLDQQLEQAKMVRAWCRANPDGAEVKFNNGATKEFTAEEVAAKLALAEADLDAAPEARERLVQREAAKPWEQAERILPGIFDKGTAGNDFLLATLKKCPELKLRLPNWEMAVAAMARGIIEATEESKGVAKYVRMELKGKGKPAVPAAGTKPATQPAKKPVTTSGNKPAVQAKGVKPAVDVEALTAAALAGDDTARRKLLRYELEGAA